MASLADVDVGETNVNSTVKISETVPSNVQSKQMWRMNYA
jgi:hypothetical protein